jgi:hypothetical protein
MKNQLKNLIPVFILIGFIVIGILIYKDFGIPFDEPAQMEIGYVNYHYIRLGDPALLTYGSRYHGPIIEVLLLLSSSLSLIPRHLAIFLIFVCGLIMFYFLSRRIFHNSWMGLLAAGILAISPRIFADAFYNSKDIPLLVAFIAAILTLVLLSDGLVKNHKRQDLFVLLVLHASASAVLISIRVAGVAIIPLTLFLVLFQLLNKPVFWRRKALISFGYLVLTAGLTILLWPILWHNPWGEFINAFFQMANFPFLGKVLFMGYSYSADQLPWQYLPVWIGITTPVIVLTGILPGILDWAGSILNKLGWRKKGGNDPVVKSWDPEIFVWTVVMGWLVIPVSAIYILHSAIYDGWRQMFFIYPAIVLISLRGLQAFYKWVMHFNKYSNSLRIAACILLLVGLAEPIWFMVRYHPYENVYFNVFSGDPSTLRQRFDLDYWGLSYKQAIDFILANDPSQNIKIAVADMPGIIYIDEGLTAEQQSRLNPVSDIGDAKYFVSDFRFHPENYPYANEYYSINVRGTKIMVVYKR